jgi:peptidyl-dipeptidase Dcp
MFNEFGPRIAWYVWPTQEYPILFPEPNVARDYVEFPSQFNEHWALDSKVLKELKLVHNIKPENRYHNRSRSIIKRQSIPPYNEGYAILEQYQCSSVAGYAMA